MRVSPCDHSPSLEREIKLRGKWQLMAYLRMTLRPLLLTVVVPIAVPKAVVYLIYTSTAPGTAVTYLVRILIIVLACLASQQKLQPSQDRSPVLGTTYLELEWFCPRNGTEVPKGQVRVAGKSRQLHSHVKLISKRYVVGGNNTQRRRGKTTFQGIWKPKLGSAHHKFASSEVSPSSATSPVSSYKLRLSGSDNTECTTDSAWKRPFAASSPGHLSGCCVKGNTHGNRGKATQQQRNSMADGHVFGLVTVCELFQKWRE